LFVGRGDRVLFHAVIHGRFFAEAEILDGPKWTKDPVWGLRWPWVYPCRVDVWVPLIENGPRTSEIASKKKLGRIQRGADFAKLTSDEHRHMVDALLARPSVCQRR